jgi:hypothetical protein
MLGWNALHQVGKKSRINWFLIGKYKVEISLAL